jgi:hypothetical protein
MKFHTQFQLFKYIVSTRKLINRINFLFTIYYKENLMNS